MSLLHASVTGNLRAAMDQQVRQVAGALRRAAATAGKQTQDDLRAQARGAGFRDGGRALANSWRLNVYPRPGVGATSLRPAALVTSRMADVVRIFETGAVIQAKGRGYMAFPTGYNAALGRRNASKRGGVRVTAEQMIAAGKRGEAFVIASKSNPRVRLWCLRVHGAYGLTKKSRTRLRLFVNEATEIGTGKAKGAAQKRRDILERRFVPMFFLMRQVSLRKRLNVAQVEARAPGRFASAAQAELARVAR